MLIGIVGIISVGGKVRWRRCQEDPQYEALAVKVKKLSEKLEARYPAELGLRSTHPNESMGEDDTAQDE